MLALTTVATAVLELLVHGGGANTSRHAIQAHAQSSRHQADIQAAIQDTRRHESHMKAQTSRQQADIQTHESTNKKNHYRYKSAYGHTRQDRHKKTTTDTRMHRGNNRQLKHCNKTAYIDVHACKQTYMFTPCP